MAVKIYVQNEEEKQALANAIGLMSDAVDYYTEPDADMDFDENDRDTAHAFFGNVQIVIGTAQLDTALMGEIGKAYKEKYDQAVAAGDEATKFKMIGAMFAIKKVMEMVSEPAY